MAIESLTTLDLPMVVDSIGIYELKGPYYTLTMTDWFLQALSVIPTGSWGDVSRRFTMVRWALSVIPRRSCGDVARCFTMIRWVTPKMCFWSHKYFIFFFSSSLPLAAVALPSSPPAVDAAYRRMLFRQSRQGDSVCETFVYFLVQANKGIEIPVMGRIRWS
ncbi:hypothetical protein F511_22221 [Dorcoceras hygrometricum]|uniref:Uncharacterized protein n=1 Tax=Dorcoceras hygrometricum TaxID=472368 RepID=A0A2Z7DAK4_9LAMI|nr:hypothetical protein F511_22221 [Dorcoceras hygrometricum]